MRVIVKFFASLREQVGMAEVRMEVAEGATAMEAWTGAAGDLPMPANVLVAVNMEYASSDQPLRDGDEVAFFPPVTGGAR